MKVAVVRQIELGLGNGGEVFLEGGEAGLQYFVVVALFEDSDETPQRKDRSAQFDQDFAGEAELSSRRSSRRVRTRGEARRARRPCEA